MDPVWLAIGGFIFVAYTLEAITGFGSVVVALSLSAQLVPIASVVPVLIPLSVCVSGYLMWNNRRSIDRTLLLKTILPGMALGTLVGYAIRPFIDEVFSKQLFGVLIFWFAARELWRLRHARVVNRHPRWLTKLLTAAAGVTHGMFASGGPLLVYSLSGVELDKGRFRATLAAVWTTLNTMLCLVLLLDGRLLPAMPKVAAYLPMLVIGVWAGDRIHHRVREEHFRIAIYVLLLVTGALLARPR